MSFLLLEATVRDVNLSQNNLASDSLDSTHFVIGPINVPAEYYGRATAYSMTVEMALDTNGILEMTIRDKAGNNVGYVTNYKNTRTPRDE